MGFGDLKSPAGLQVLNDYLADKSYIEGWAHCRAGAELGPGRAGRGRDHVAQPPPPREERKPGPRAFLGEGAARDEGSKMCFFSSLLDSTRFFRVFAQLMNVRLWVYIRVCNLLGSTKWQAFLRIEHNRWPLILRSFFNNKKKNHLKLPREPSSKMGEISLIRRSVCHLFDGVCGFFF